jgi:hypothetical protein
MLACRSLERYRCPKSLIHPLMELGCELSVVLRNTDRRVLKDATLTIGANLAFSPETLEAAVSSPTEVYYDNRTIEPFKQARGLLACVVKMAAASLTGSRPRMNGNRSPHSFITSPRTHKRTLISAWPSPLSIVADLLPTGDQGCD